MTYLLKHLLEYHEEAKKIPKKQKFTDNELALIRALSDEPQTTKELAEKVGVQSTTINRLVNRLNEEYGGIEVQSFGRSAPSLYWKSEHFDTIYDQD